MRQIRDTGIVGWRIIYGPWGTPVLLYRIPVYEYDHEGD